ncbi:hypothetical protein niasHT_021880 [Heterodera trifolii]|uniref:Uncharacterized protein n=1 Tax=Heterodera trifolii TaxID=157864 RepID=A0ABD2JCC6_9BILA
MSSQPKKLPHELLMELVAFIRVSRKWAWCRISFAFDKFLLEKVGNWLMNMKPVAMVCDKDMESLVDSINAITNVAHRYSAAERIYRALARHSRAFSYLPTVTAFDQLIFDNETSPTVQLIMKCSNIVNEILRSAAIDRADLVCLKNCLGAMRQMEDLRREILQQTDFLMESLNLITDQNSKQAAAERLYGALVMFAGTSHKFPNFPSIHQLYLDPNNLTGRLLSESLNVVNGCLDSAASGVSEFFALKSVLVVCRVMLGLTD